MEPHVQHANTVSQYRSMEKTNLRDKENKKRWKAKPLLVHYQPVYNDVSATYGGTTGVQHHMTGNDKHATLMSQHENDRHKIHEMRTFLAAPCTERSRARSETARSRTSASTFASNGSNWTRTPWERGKVAYGKGEESTTARKERQNFKDSLSKSYLKKNAWWHLWPMAWMATL